jgi:hypothetical protein
MKVIIAFAIISIERNSSTIAAQVWHVATIQLYHTESPEDGIATHQNCKGRCKAGGAVVQSYMCVSAYNASLVQYDGGRYLLCRHIYWRASFCTGQRRLERRLIRRSTWVSSAICGNIQVNPGSTGATTVTVTTDQYSPYSPLKLTMPPHFRIRNRKSCPRTVLHIRAFPHFRLLSFFLCFCLYLPSSPLCWQSRRS